MKIGCIGLGIMGKPMAKHFIEAGHEVYLYDVNEAAVNELVQLGGKAATLQTVAAQAEYIITSLPNGEIVKAVLYNGQDALSAQPTINTKYVIDTSSITPSDALEIHKTLEDVGVQYFDAPVSGGEPLAITGELAVMIGCDEAALETVKTVLEPVAASVTRVGNVGAGSVVKLANQIIVNTNIVALSEAVVLAKQFDIQLEDMFEAIRGGLAGSAVMEAKFPKMIAEDYAPGGTININYKDLKNVMMTADTANLALPVANMVKEMYKAEVASDRGNNDHSGIIKYIENINKL
ncbi:MAG: NAD(P)-binding domain-containing protein [Staphylococcus rostri]|uniref:NAD(P)-binding domain-containing protein n=1 Tax=Staphylococcus rostri TaxID=522262 RepID=UPI0026DF6AF8|nr:NAD(P)-binding domain-containing protein [Staphylococcus rostri]MDO5376354.1 NAD(P)-binding domain-containing protein [Staphylococcus rostri]